MEGLIAGLKKRRVPIGIPTPVLGEFLSKLTPEEKEQFDRAQASSAFSMLPYDVRCAHESAEMELVASISGRRKGKDARPRQAVKVDRQIIAIAKVNRATLVLTHDEDVIAEAARHGVKACRISDLQIPDNLKQHRLELPAPDEDEKGQH